MFLSFNCAHPFSTRLAALRSPHKPATLEYASRKAVQPRFCSAARELQGVCWILDVPCSSVSTVRTLSQHGWRPCALHTNLQPAVFYAMYNVCKIMYWSLYCNTAMCTLSVAATNVPPKQRRATSRQPASLVVCCTARAVYRGCCLLVLVRECHTPACTLHPACS